MAYYTIIYLRKTRYIYDVVIVGSGMSGALTALTLAESGLKVAIVGKREMAVGSSNANTSRLRYSNRLCICRQLW